MLKIKEQPSILVDFSTETPVITSSETIEDIISIDCPPERTTDADNIPFLYVKSIVINFTSYIKDDVSIKINNIRFPDRTLHNLQRKFSTYSPNNPHPSETITTMPDGVSKIPYGSIIEIEAFNGWPYEYSLSCWTAELTFNNDKTQVYNGGMTYDGVANEDSICSYINLPCFYDYRSLGSFTAIYKNIYTEYENCLSCNGIIKRKSVSIYSETTGNTYNYWQEINNIDGILTIQSFMLGYDSNGNEIYPKMQISNDLYPPEDLTGFVVIGGIGMGKIEGPDPYFKIVYTN